MTRSDSAAEVERLERAFWKSIVDADADAATSMLTEPALLVGSHGATRFDHAFYTKMLADDGMRLVEYSLSDLDVLLPTDDVAVVSYDVEQTVEAGGKRITQRATDSSTWVRIDGAWKCVAHTESLQKPSG